MPAKKKPPVPVVAGQPRHYDPNLGKAALTNLAPRLKSLDPGEILSTRVDVEAAALAALATYARATAPALRTRFQKQHEIDEFDMAHLNDLEELAFAVLYAHAEASVARASETSAKLPLALVEQAIAVEERMRTLCEYHFRDDPDISAELDRLRPGTGHRDLASDLLGYARIYEMRRDVVILDRKHYRSTDMDEARSVAGVILTHLSAEASSKTRQALDALARAWTLLCQSYDELRAVGLHLLRNNHDKHRMFPSLYVAAKNIPATRRRHKAGAANTTHAEETD